jgi:hypothetical protein
MRKIPFAKPGVGGMSAVPKIMSKKSDFGLIGLAVMGQNLVLNVESRGFQVSVYNRTTSVTDEFSPSIPAKPSSEPTPSKNSSRASPHRARSTSW